MAHGGRPLIGGNCPTAASRGCGCSAAQARRPRSALGAKRARKAWKAMPGSSSETPETRADEFVRVASFGGD
jgi:hypothetical protein